MRNSKSTHFQARQSFHEKSKLQEFSRRESTTRTANEKIYFIIFTNDQEKRIAGNFWTLDDQYVSIKMPFWLHSEKIQLPLK